MAEANRAFLARIGQQPGDPGRATKYDPEFCNTIRMLAQAGEFPETWAATIGVTLGTMRRWAKEHDEFREAVVIAHHLLQSYWVRDLAKARHNPAAKVGIYALIMRRFPALYGKTPVDLAQWLVEPEPQEATEAGVVPGATEARSLKDQELDARIAALQERRAQERGS